jgi:hypothetical protein
VIRLVLFRGAKGDDRRYAHASTAAGDKNVTWARYDIDVSGTFVWVTLTDLPGRALDSLSSRHVRPRDEELSIMRILCMPNPGDRSIAVLVTRGSGLTRVVGSDQPGLILVVCLGLTECESSLSPHSLCRSDFLDGFLESENRVSLT